MEKTKQEKIEELRKLKETKKPEEKHKKPKKKDPKDAKIKELTETLQRLQAEFENYKKRIEKEKIEFIIYAKQDLIIKLLPILDSLEIALKNTSDKDKFIKGVELIFSQLYQTLQQEGLKPIKALGEKFDPYKHEVLMNKESDKEDDIILEELQKGYMLNNKVIRHTKVKVSKKNKFK